LFRMADPDSGSAGFTIIEAVIALALVAVMLSAIGPLIATSMRGVRSVEQHAELVATARAVEAGLPDRGELGVGNLSGDHAGHRWRVDVSPYAGVVVPASAAWTPQSVIITVRSPSGAALRIDTIRLRHRSSG